MRFSLHLVPDDLSQVARRARFAEDHGFDQVWVAESHLTCRDHNVALALAILNTKTILIGPGVTNPVLHDNSVAACTIATLDELSQGRALFGIGSGDTPVYTLGKKMAKLAVMRESIRQIRALVGGEEVEYGPGVKVRMWAKRKTPVYVAAEGPKTIQSAAEIADGVIIGSGVLRETVEWVEGHLRRGMENRDKCLGLLDVIYGTVISVGRDDREARERVRARVANRAHHNFRRTLESVPERHRPEIQHLLEHFDVSDWRSPEHASLVTDYILDRFTVTGTPERCVERLREIERYGVKSLMIDPPIEGFDEALELFAREVMPRCR